MGRASWFATLAALVALGATVIAPSTAGAEEPDAGTEEQTAGAEEAGEKQGEGNPLQTLDRAVDRTPHRGLIIDALSAGPYTYLLVQRSGEEPEERWVVTMRDGLEPGMLVRVAPIGRRRGFESARLHRQFDELWFAAVRAVEPD